LSSVILTGDTSGTLTVSAPLVAGTNTLTLAAATGTLSPLVSATAVTASGTSIDFTSIPSWVKRITVMFQGVSTNGSSNWLIQIGAGSVTTTGYTGYSVNTSASALGGGGITTSIASVRGAGATDVCSGLITISTLGNNIWAAHGMVGSNANNNGYMTAGGITLGGTLDRVRITTANGTDTFDAGSINIMYEG